MWCTLTSFLCYGAQAEAGTRAAPSPSASLCAPQCLHPDLPVHYGAQAEAGSEEYGGPKPFSEPESRVVRLVAETARPQAYVALHSGEYALYAPWDSEARAQWLRGYGV